MYFNSYAVVVMLLAQSFLAKALGKKVNASDPSHLSCTELWLVTARAHKKCHFNAHPITSEKGFLSITK